MSTIKKSRMATTRLGKGGGGTTLAKKRGSGMGVMAEAMSYKDANIQYFNYSATNTARMKNGQKESPTRYKRIVPANNHIQVYNSGKDTEVDKIGKKNLIQHLSEQRQEFVKDDMKKRKQVEKVNRGQNKTPVIRYVPMGNTGRSTPDINLGRNKLFAK